MDGEDLRNQRLPPSATRSSPARLPQSNTTPQKRRSLSDSHHLPPTLEPSPHLNERIYKARDDDVLIATPLRTPRRVDLSARGLYLQMPARDPSTTVNTSGIGLGLPSPQFEQREPHGSPSVLPRHSRGLDFSRAATHLHHSTIAEQPSPDSSPTVTQRQMLPPSRRGSSLSMMLDLPRPISWNLPNAERSDKGSMSRSAGSANALTSEASSSSSDDDDTLMDQDEGDDAMLATPQAQKIMGGDVVTPYEPQRWSMEDANGSNTQSPVSSAFANYRRGILGKRHAKYFRDHPYSRHRTSSPEPGSSTADGQGNGAHRDVLVKSPRSRRESLSLGIGTGLHITSSNEEVDDSPFTMTPSTPGVVRRPVVRRSNMLPKTKNFARIKAALQEESAPVDNEARRESEVVRQVRGKDVGRNSQSQMSLSPNLAPTVPNLSNEPSEMSSLEASGVRGDFNNSSFADFRRNSLGRDFWQNSHNRSSTPPPHAFLNRHRSSSGFSIMSEDVSTDSPISTTPPSSTCVATDTKPSIEIANSHIPFQPFLPANTNVYANFPTAAEMTRKINKRRRDDDFDVNSFKRRAVSPGLSVQSSPILGQSPVSNTGCWPARLSREGSVPSSNGGTSSAAGGATSVPEERSQSKSAEDRSASNGSTSVGLSTPVLGPKRVGLQGMTDTNDGLMKMSIDRE